MHRLGKSRLTPTILASLGSVKVNKDTDVILSCPGDRLFHIRPLRLVFVDILPEWRVFAVTVCSSRRPVSDLTDGDFTS